MGTSASSKGPGSGVSFDPPWLDDIELPYSEPTSPDKPEQPNEQQPIVGKDEPKVLMVAPPARFRGAKVNLGNYIKTGDTSSLRRSLGHYSKTGMGGAQRVANRMRLSTSVGAGLFRSLQSVREGTNPSLADLFSKLAANNADVYQFVDAIVDNVCPSGGSPDEESCRDSANYAISGFLNKNPDADISNLSDDALWSLTASFLGHEAFSRVQFDIGNTFEKKQVTWQERISRLKEMREYMEAEISAQINKLRTISGKQSSQSLRAIFEKTIENTFRVYEVEV